MGWGNRACAELASVGPQLLTNSSTTDFRAWELQFVSKSVVRLVTYSPMNGKMLCSGSLALASPSICSDSGLTIASSPVQDSSDQFVMVPVPKYVRSDAHEVYLVSRIRSHGCDRFISAIPGCRHGKLRLVKKDDGTGLQRWIRSKIAVPSPAPSPVPSSVPSPVLIGGCAGVAPSLRAQCCVTNPTSPGCPYSPSPVPSPLPSPLPVPSPSPSPSPFVFPTPTCSGHGDLCSTWGLSCCQGLSCVLVPMYGAYCLPIVPSPPPPSPPPPSPPPPSPPPPPPPLGSVSLYAGIEGKYGYSGDGGAATNAKIYYPYGLSLDSDGNLYICDYMDNVIRMVNASSGNISTVAGNYTKGGSYSGDGSPATNASLNYPSDLALDSRGNIYIADTNNNVIRLVNTTTKIISTVAGNNTFGYSGDNGQATRAQINNPRGVAVDTDGNIYIADTSNSVVRLVNATTKIITTIAGNHTPGYSGDNGLATNAQLRTPRGLAIDNSGNLYIADYNSDVVRLVNATTKIITTYAGNHSIGGTYYGDGGPARSAGLYNPFKLALDIANNLYISDKGNNVVRKVDAFGNISTVAGNKTASPQKFNGGGLSSFANSTPIGAPAGVAVDPQGDLYIGDSSDFIVLRVNG